MNPPEALEQVPPHSNRCHDCGELVGERFTGYTADKTSKREPLLCEPCVKASLLEGAP